MTIIERRALHARKKAELGNDNQSHPDDLLYKGKSRSTKGEIILSPKPMKTNKSDLVENLCVCVCGGRLLFKVKRYKYIQSYETIDLDAQKILNLDGTPVMGTTSSTHYGIKALSSLYNDDFDAKSYVRGTSTFQPICSMIII